MRDSITVRSSASRDQSRALCSVRVFRSPVDKMQFGAGRTGNGLIFVFERRSIVVSRGRSVLAQPVPFKSVYGHRNRRYRLSRACLDLAQNSARRSQYAVVVALCVATAAYAERIIKAGPVLMTNSGDTVRCRRVMLQ